LFSCARKTAGSYFGPSGVGAAKVQLSNLDVVWLAANYVDIPKVKNKKCNSSTDEHFESGLAVWIWSSSDRTKVSE
jgi:hypothetical protein